MGPICRKLGGGEVLWRVVGEVGGRGGVSLVAFTGGKVFPVV